VCFGCFHVSPPMALPTATMNIMYDYARLHNGKVSAFCNYHGVHNTRIKRLISTRNNLVTRVSDFVGLDPSLLKLHEPISKAPHAKLLLLRLIQVWVFHETIIEYHPPSQTRVNPDGSFPVKLKGSRGLEEKHLASLLRKDKYPFSLKTHAEIEQTGGFTSDTELDLVTFLVGFEERFVSYAIQKGLDVCWLWYEEGLQLYVCSSDFYGSLDYQSLRKHWDGTSEESVLLFVEASSNNCRGRRERDSGKWSIVQNPLDVMALATSKVVQIKKFTLRGKRYGTGISNGIRAQLRRHFNLKGCLAFDFSKNLNKPKNRRSIAFQIFCGGSSAFKVTDVDLCDMLSISRLDTDFWLLDKHEGGYQALVFENVNDAETRRSGTPASPGRRAPSDSSTEQPLLRNAPEGARLLSVLAASRRREHTIHIALPSTEDSEEEDEEECFIFSLEGELSKLQFRWTRMDTDRAVFVMENSVCSSVIPVESIGKLYACCANTLDLRGGGMRADNLTLLPPGGYFLLLALLAFGLTPEGLVLPKESDDLEAFINDCIAWAKAREPSEADKDRTSLALDWDSRLRMAIEFGRSCYDLGEQLECFPNKVKNLCVIFDRVDGYETAAWPKLESDPFIPMSAADRKQRDVVLAGLQRPGQSYGRMDSGTVSEPSQRHQSYGRMNSGAASESGQPGAIGLARRLLPVTAGQTMEREAGERKRETVADNVLRGEEVLAFSDQLMASAQTMFTAELNAKEDVLVSTNILTIILKQCFAGLQYEALLQPDRREELLSAVDRFGVMKLDKDHWVVYRFADEGGEAWYQAEFVNKCLPLKGRSDRGWVYWHRHSTSRPWTAVAAAECVPPRYRNIKLLQTEICTRENKKYKATLFGSIEDALSMEAAFWLEANFGTKEKHWYEQSFPELVLQLVNRMLPSGEEILRKLKSHVMAMPN
jgi:hypothetical protein